MELITPLLKWYDANKRALPWRETHDPYRIWVSEIMLQQTRAAAVIPYYHRFLEALPDVFALAACEEERLLKLWEGLGYYSRARNLKKSAEVLVRDHGGCFPPEADELKKLPGIGAYTAGAIASIAFGRPEPAVDGNVLRILARVTDDGRNILDASLQAEYRETLREQDLTRAGDVNQAFMDLGSLVCLPKNPGCGECPLSGCCKGHLAGRESVLPYREKAKARRQEKLTVFYLVTEQGEIIRRRPGTGLLPGLYEYPHETGHLGTDAALGVLSGWGLRPAGSLLCYDRKHVFTHVEWHMRVYACRTEPILPEGCVFSTGKEPLPTAFLKCRPEG